MKTTLLGTLSLFLPSRFRAAAAPVSQADGLTFFTISDLHYDWPKVGDYTFQRQAITQMNMLPGAAFPKAIGGQVAAPRGVIVLGDLVDNNDHQGYAAWEADFGLKGEKLLRYPVYEGVGNHDNRGNGAGWTGVKRRNPLRTGLDHISPNGYHYSWTWNGIHFVMLNICAADKADPVIKHNKIQPREALDFLASDLQKCLGDSGRPVIVLQHYSLYQLEWFSQAEVDAMMGILKAYNVICLVHGHSHASRIYRVGNIDVVDDGSVKNGKDHPDPAHAMFYVFRIQGNRLTAQQRMVNGRWGKLCLDKTFSLGRTHAVAAVG